MNEQVDVLAVLDVRRELGVKQSTKNANAAFVDWRDWCAFLSRADEARAAVAELIEATTSAKNAIAIIAAAEESETSDKMHQLMFDDLPRLRVALARVGGAA
jgi:hypothetical protein